MKRSTWRCLAAALFSLGLVLPATAQRMQFATPVAQLGETAVPTPSAYAAPGGPTMAAAPAGGVYTGPTAPMGAPAYGAPAAAPAWPAPTGAAPYGGYGPYGGGAPLATPPGAALEGSIYAPPSNWDPFAVPGTQPQPLMPYDPVYSPGATGPELAFLGPAQRFLKQLRLESVWMPGGGEQEMGVTDFDTSVTFAIPFLYNARSPLLITPGFGMTFFNGPSSVEAIDVPPHVFDAYLDTAWNPQLSQAFGGELAFRISVNSDFERTSGDSIRYQAKGLAVLAFSPSVKVKAGVWYIDRVRIKLLPAGGIAWTPNQDVRFDITFPDPKLSRRLTMVGVTEWWIYARGEYGGDTWTTYADAPGRPGGPEVELFDYNDIRTGIGFEFFRPAGLHGAFEVGVAWDREVFFRGGPDIQLNSCVYLRGLLTY